jgi:hypothetical protein
MSIFKPTLAKLVLAALLTIVLVPFIQLSQPECAEYAKLPHGDGAPTVCVEGWRTPLTYGLLAAKGSYNMDYNGSWNWKVNVMPNYALLVLGLIAAYVVACLLVHYIIKLRSTKKREAKESR